MRGGAEERGWVHCCEHVWLRHGALLPWPARAAAHVRNALEDALDQLAPYPASALLRGVVLAEGGFLPDDIGDDFRDTGTYHVLITAGIHVHMLLACWLLLSRSLRLSGQFGNALGIPLVMAYAVVVGGSASITRASTMAAIGLGADALGRERDSMAALCAAVVAMLWLEPQWLDETSFHMSVCCVLGIRCLTTPCAQALGWLPAWARDAAAVTLATQLAVAPLSVEAFHTLPLAAVFANLLVVPLCEALLAIGLAGGLLGALFAALPTPLSSLAPLLHLLAAVPISMLAGTAIAIAHVLAAGPALSMSGVGVGAACVYYAILLGWARLAPKS
jgi:competence protein ComEC